MGCLCVHFSLMWQQLICLGRSALQNIVYYTLHCISRHPLDIFDTFL